MRGIRVHYEVLGDAGTWVVLTPGGHASLEGMRPVGEALAREGWRVLLHDRRNCGASDLVIDGKESEQEIWADDLHALLDQLGALPAWAGGSSAGMRLSLLLELRHPGATRGLMLSAITGGKVAAERLGQAYYGQYIPLAETGSMLAVADTPYFRELSERNPESRERLLSLSPAHFIDVMTRWRQFFLDGAELPVIGLDESALRGISVPVCIVPGNDPVHPRVVGERLHAILSDSELHYLWSDEEYGALAGRDVARVMAESRSRLASIFGDFLARRSSDHARRPNELTGGE